MHRDDILRLFDWRDPSLEAESLARRIHERLQDRSTPPPEGEERLLRECWAPPRGPGMEARLALHFMEQKAPVTERVPRGLAYAAITTMRLERPLGQQEEFNRAVLMFARWATAEVTRLQQRVDALESP